MIGQQQLFRGFAPEAFGVVEVDFDHQYAGDLLAVPHGSGEKITAFGGRGAESEKAPEPPGHGFTEIRPEREIAPDETVVFVPVGSGQGLARGVHQVHDLGAGLGADVFQQAVGVALGDTIVRRTEHGAQGRQIAEDLRQHFVAVQRSQQVGDIKVEGLAVLPGQFAAVVTLGQMLQRPQQRRQAQREQGQAAPAGSAGEGRSHMHRTPVGMDALCLDGDVRASCTSPLGVTDRQGVAYRPERWRYRRLIKFQRLLYAARHVDSSRQFAQPASDCGASA
ncbi:hypothetical protein D3C71_945670 [compost metagenome]